MSEEKEFGWNDALPPPQEKKVMPEGDAEWEVLKLERARKPMGKLGTVNTAVLTLLVTSLEDPTCSEKMEENLPLAPSMSWKLYQFFASAGQYAHGDVEKGKPFTPNWGKVEGATGLCTIVHREWERKDKTKAKSPQIGAYLDDKGRSRASDEPRAVGKKPVEESAEVPDEIPF
jgi:hypothetical protein